MRASAKAERRSRPTQARLRPYAFCLLTLACLSCACRVDERRAIPSEAQATIDRVTEEIAAGRDEEIYAEAAEEWRASASAAENKRVLGATRTRLGRVSSRALHSGSESGGRGRPAAGRSLVVTYQTTFERGTAMETFTLIERDGRWLLAGYAISSDALKQ